MKRKNVLIVVKDIEKSKQFYHDMFGLDKVLENNGNVILTEGLVLQDINIWNKSIGKENRLLLVKCPEVVCWQDF